MNISKVKQMPKKRRTIALIAAVALLLIATLLAVLLSSKPTRSVAAFCSTYKQENARLEKGSGDTYNVKPFTHSSSNPRDFVVALSNLREVAPKDIEPDVKTLEQIFEKIDKDPSQALPASLSGLGAESSVSDWADQHCR